MNTYHVWQNQSETKELINKLHQLKLTLLNHAARLAAQSNLEQAEVHKFLIKANTIDTIIFGIKTLETFDSSKLI